MEYILIIFVIIILIIGCLKNYKNFKEKSQELEKFKEKYKGIIDIEEEKNKLKNDIHEIELRLELEKNNLKADKEKALKLVDYRERLKTDISLLEETKDLQEFGIYQPRFYYENSESYRNKLIELSDEIKQMIKDKRAAICTTEWLVEGSKAKGNKMTNETLKLMIRTFNGEADLAIAKVKFSNISVMEARIYKSFETINKLNQVKACYITKEYLQAKIDELYLNFEMAEKLQEEKEEIRRAREEDRENERARKEYEKAQAEALKEEERARKALEKAEEKLKTVHGEQLEKLNEQINNLKMALEQAQKDKERAKSMAELTKAGHVYVISNIGSFGENVYKIGMTRRLEPMDRVRELGDASVPFNFDVHAMIYSENAPELENALHKEFYKNRVNKINDRREFFRVDLQEIEKVAKKYKGDVKFTMEAQAEQYRQTIAMENENNNLENSLKEKSQKIQEEKNFILNM